MPEMTGRSSTRGFPGLPCGRWGFNVFHASSDSQNKLFAMPSASSDSNHGKNISLDQRSVWVLNLVAELASAFLCAEFGINKEVRHASYIANWIELLRADDRAFFTAASQAQKAADYLRGLALTESLLETVA